MSLSTEGMFGLPCRGVRPSFKECVCPYVLQDRESKALEIGKLHRVFLRCEGVFGIIPPMFVWRRDEREG